MSWEIAGYAYRNISNFKLEELRQFYETSISFSELVSKGVAEFSDKFSHFQYAIQGPN